MKRSLIAVAAIAALPLLGVAATASAAPAGHNTGPRDGTGLYCTAVTQTLCISSTNTIGATVLTRTPANSSSFTTVGHFKCTLPGGGSTDLVQDPSVQGDGPSCPFINGDGMNTRFEGHEIVQFKTSGLNCMGADLDFDDPTIRDCTSTGTDWVRAKTSDPYAYVNVKASNTTATPIAIEGDGPAGTAAQTNNLDTSNSFQLWSRQ